MGRHVAQQTPASLPGESQVREAVERSTATFVVAGSRGVRNRDNRNPDPGIHTGFKLVTGRISRFRGRNVVVFVHGYNVTTNEGLTAAGDFFGHFHESLKEELRSNSDDDTFIRSFRHVLFTWPGDTGTIYFNRAQAYAQLSGVALYRFLSELDEAGAKSITIVAHSLGAHVTLRALSILGERRFRGRVGFRVKSTILLAAAVEDDVFRRPQRTEEFHFPEAAFGTESLQMVVSRADNVLGAAFRVNEFDKAMGYSGPESMSTLQSLSRRVEAVLGESFEFELHDFSPNSATIFNDELHVHSHGGYWENRAQTDYYANFVGT